MRVDQKIIIEERRRSARFVSFVYALMAFVFAGAALTLVHANQHLGIPQPTALTMAAAFTTLGVANLIILEFWRRTFRLR